jgi:putative RecB family exonuclease
MNNQNSNELVAPEFLSPSSINTFRQCPLKFKYSKIDGLPDPSGQEAILGNYVHAVLEQLYKLEPDERTQERANQILRELWNSEWGKKANGVIFSKKDLNLFMWSAWWCVENLWHLEDPTQTNPWKMECFVTGEIGGVKVRGYIDRLLLNNKDLFTNNNDEISDVVISDYKTGKTPTRESDFDEKFFQLFAYSGLLSHLKIGKEKRVSVELLYLKDGVRFKRQVTDSDLNKTIEIIQQTKRDIDDCCKSGNFQHKKSVLCGWCSFKPLCPAWGGHYERKG